MNSTLDAEVAAVAEQSHVTHNKFLDALKRPAIWGYSACYFFISVAIFGLFLWLPQVIALQFPGRSSTEVSLVTAIPFACGFVALLVAGRSSDRTGDRRWHLVSICAVGAIALAVSALAPWVTVQFVALCVAVACVYAYLPPFWPNPMSVLSGSAAVGGLALINSLGTFGGFFGPNIIGILKGISGSFATSLALFSGFLLLAGLLPLLAPSMFPRATRVSQQVTDDFAQGTLVNEG